MAIYFAHKKNAKLKKCIDFAILLYFICYSFEIAKTVDDLEICKPRVCNYLINHCPAATS